MGLEKVSRALILALSVCVVLATTPGLRILCVGSDGHVSVEMAFDDCCEHPVPSTEGEFESSCEGCEDELLAAPSVLAKDPASLDDLMAGVWFALPLPSSVPAPNERALRTEGAGPPWSNEESSSRSVVLRC